MISVPCSMSLRSHLGEKDSLILHIERKKKKIKMTWRALTDISLSLCLHLSSGPQSHCCPLWSFYIHTDRSTICPCRPQHRYRLAGRKRPLLGGNAMPISPSAKLVSTLRNRVDSIGHRRRGYYDANLLLPLLSITSHIC